MEEGNEAPAAWQKSPAIPGVGLTWDRTTSHEGKASLCLKKTAQRYFPIASWSQSSSVEPASEARNCFSSSADSGLAAVAAPAFSSAAEVVSPATNSLSVL